MNKNEKKIYLKINNIEELELSNVDCILKSPIFQNTYVLIEYAHRDSIKKTANLYIGAPLTLEMV